MNKIKANKPKVNHLKLTDVLIFSLSVWIIIMFFDTVVKTFIPLVAIVCYISMAINFFLPVFCMFKFKHNYLFFSLVMLSMFIGFFFSVFSFPFLVITGLSIGLVGYYFSIRDLF